MEQQPQSTPQSNPFSTMHKQRLYSFIIAVVAFITLFLPWISFGFLHFTGFHSWGWLSFLGAVAVIGLSFFGNKELPFDANIKNAVMGGFAAIAIGALIFLLTISSYGAGLFGSGGAGIGMWLCLLVGLAGLAFSLGLIKIPEKK
jgi:hypothetical protein